MVATVLYVGYLVQVGLLMIYMPWSETWDVLIVRLPPWAASVLGHPAVCGALTAFGFLHLALVAVEFRQAGGAAAEKRRG